MFSFCCANCLFIIFFAIYIQYSYANSDSIKTNLYSLNFDEIKLNLFLNSDLNSSFYKPEQFNSQKDALQCVKVLNAIKNGLIHFDKWAIKRKSNFQMNSMLKNE